MLEQIRDLLYQLSGKYGFTHPVMLQISGAFDRLCLEEIRGWEKKS